MNHRWDFASVLDNTDALLAGAAGTLRIFAICIVAGLAFGLLVGLARTSQRRWIDWPASAFVEFFRNTPVLVQILWFYFALPMLVPFSISPLAAAALGISFDAERQVRHERRGVGTGCEARERGHHRRLEVAEWSWLIGREVVPAILEISACREPTDEDRRCGRNRRQSVEGRDRQFGFGHERRRDRDVGNGCRGTAPWELLGEPAELAD
jgi:His/Glu/Gln/Arg/opine family amino acid ABC transporter permease subunit